MTLIQPRPEKSLLANRLLAYVGSVCCLVALVQTLTRDVVLSAETYKGLKKGDKLVNHDFQSFLSSASQQQLQEAAGAENDIVALHAAWRLVSNQVRSKSENVDALSFFPIVEKRARFSLPGWWMSVARSARLTENMRVRFDVANHRAYVRSEMGIFAPNRTSIKSGKTGVLVEAPGKLWLIIKPPKGALEWEYPSMTVASVNHRTLGVQKRCQEPLFQ